MLLFSSPEFFGEEAVRAKVKTPFEFVASALRASGAELAALPGQEHGDRPGALVALRALGQAPYSAQPPTGYEDTADAWVSTGALLNRHKLAIGIASGRLPGIRIDPATRRPGRDAESLAVLAEQVFGLPAPDRLLATVRSNLEGSDDRMALGWLLASAEFQRR